MAMRKYLEKQESDGKPESYETAKEIIAAIAGAEADKLIETKGLTEVDQLRARHQAEGNAKRALAQSGQFGGAQYEPRSFEQSRYGGGGGGGYDNNYGGERREEHHRHGRGGEGGGFDGRGGFPGDQEMRGGRMEGEGYGEGRRGEYEGQGGYQGQGQGGYGGGYDDRRY
ncbi:hypothetical protein QFC20_002243 [Naganishia adeliensis]|uniref:Uncharacterized protein n=1 Tax=Naganishia adeliensis TaxID=92952 RepID=A0ACC2WMR6_9TREE|nr:hypothetical protein QFC20_002243 [Naganishia adeliensis]